MDRDARSPRSGTLRDVTRPRRPKTAPELGLMAGSPPPTDRLVTLANWQDPPFNRWGFLHVRELMPTARISRGDGPVARLLRDERDLDGVAFRVGRRTLTVGRMLDETYTDGFLVLHGGRIVTERYIDGMTPDTTHLLMSVSKSLTASLAGVLAGRGAFDPAAPVTDYVEELRGTSFEGCTVQHLLDMRAGTRFNEDYADLKADVRVYEQVAGWRPRTGRHLPPDLYTYMSGLRNVRAHGGPFDYRSILTDVLGWALERAGGASFATLFSRDIWSGLGAEFDAEVTVDPRGCALEDGGICTTLRDLARFGWMHLQGGRIAGRRVLPAGWVRGCARPDPELRRAFEASPDTAEFPDFPRAHYHNQWWVLDPERRIYSGLGINGQQLLIHTPSRTVVVKFSTQPDALDLDMVRLQLAGSVAVCEALAVGGV